jgi:hypothetical protein
MSPTNGRRHPSKRQRPEIVLEKYGVPSMIYRVFQINPNLILAYYSKKISLFRINFVTPISHVDSSS